MSAAKRRVPRRKINRPVGLLFKGEYLVERVFQVGEGGLMVSSVTPLAAEDRVLITFSLQGEGFITSKATIRYEVKEGSQNFYGLEFDELPFQARREIRSFVASHSRGPKNFKD
jgi:hypothetical protein